MVADEYQSRDRSGAGNDELIDEIGENIRTYKNQQAAKNMPDGQPDREAIRRSINTLRDDIAEYADRVLNDDDWERFQAETGDDEYSAADLAGDITRSIKDNDYERAGQQIRKLEQLAGTDELTEQVGRYLR